MTKTLHSIGRFKDQVALITGGASGIGRATALRLASEGAEVVIVDRNAELGNDAVSQIKQSGGKAIFVQVDLMNDADIKVLDQKISKQFPALHILINNAAILRTGCIESGEWLSNWEPETQIGLRSWVLVTQVLLPLMKEEGGAIVNLSSEGGFLGRPGQWIYDAIKAAVVSVTKTMAYEFVDYDIRVNAVAPGWIVTEMHYGQHPEPESHKRELETKPISSCIMKRLAVPEEVASAISFLASNDASYITGTTLHVDGGRMGMSVG